MIVLLIPVEISFFNALANGKTSYLSWRTKQEISNHHFYLEHSTDAINWHHLVNITGAGNSEVSIAYNWVHRHPQQGINYYRLSQVDYDGRIHYYGVKKVVIEEQENVVQFYPNPTTNFINISGITEDGTIHLYDAVGRCVLRQTTSANQPDLRIDLSGQPYGLYRGRLLNKEGHTSRIFSVVKH